MTRAGLYVSRVLLASSLLAAPFVRAQATDAQLQADVHHQLNKKQFRDVQAQVQGGVVTLGGSVALLADKLDAEKRVEKTHEASSIQNHITVTAGEVSDQQLYDKLGKGLAYDRQGYPSFPFNSIGLQVHGGVVTLTGEVVEPVDKDSAVGLVTNTRGVTGLVDQLKVAPVSPNDWQIRRAMYQAVYGASVSLKYANNPVKPIRIVVENGHAVLTGVVNNQGDRDIIYQRANGVPGAFSVKNELQVEGQGNESAH